MGIKLEPGRKYVMRNSPRYIEYYELLVDGSYSYKLKRGEEVWLRYNNWRETWLEDGRHVNGCTEWDLVAEYVAGAGSTMGGMSTREGKCNHERWVNATPYVDNSPLARMACAKCGCWRDACDSSDDMAKQIKDAFNNLKLA